MYKNDSILPLWIVQKINPTIACSIPLLVQVQSFFVSFLFFFSFCCLTLILQVGRLIFLPCLNSCCTSRYLSTRLTGSSFRACRPRVMHQSLSVGERSNLCTLGKTWTPCRPHYRGRTKHVKGYLEVRNCLHISGTILRHMDLTIYTDFNRYRAVHEIAVLNLAEVLPAEHVGIVFTLMSSCSNNVNRGARQEFRVYYVRGIPQLTLWIRQK